jgi:hypothetical protein
LSCLFQQTTPFFIQKKKEQDVREKDLSKQRDEGLDFFDCLNKWHAGLDGRAKDLNIWHD